MKYFILKPALLFFGFSSAVLLGTESYAVELKNLDGFEAIFGRYAPAGDCKRQPRIVVAKNGFTFEAA